MSDVTERFKVKADDGTVYDVVALQDRIEKTSLDGKSFLYGLKKFELEDGRKINKIDDDTFEIVQSGERLLRAK